MCKEIKEEEDFSIEDSVDASIQRLEGFIKTTKRLQQPETTQTTQTVAELISTSTPRMIEVKRVSNDSQKTMKETKAR